MVQQELLNLFSQSATPKPLIKEAEMFKDKTKKFGLLDNPFKKLHGHTKIELTDVVTGEKKVIEHDNNFQAGVLASYMRSLGAFNNNPYDNDTWNSQAKWRNLVGGILLFRDAIDDSDGEVEYMPDGNQMTANGAYGVVNSGQPVEMGSWNEVESVVGSDSIVMVYDWDTSHGNGTIGCICLSSETGGYIGYGNPSGVAASTRNFFSNQNSRSVVGFIHHNSRYEIHDGGIRKTKLCVTEGSVFDGIQVNIEHAWTGNQWVADSISGKAVCFTSNWGSSAAPGGSFTLDIFDCETETFETKTIINSSGAIIGFRNASCADGIVYFAQYVDGTSNSNPLYGFSLTDGSFIGASVLSGSISSAFRGKITDDLLMCGDDNNVTRIKTDSQDNTSWKVTNGKLQGQMTRINYFSACYDPVFNAIIINGDGKVSSSSGGCQAFKNPLYLATVNNLSSPVTKNNTQTMKVTYTLTEVS